VWTDNTITEVVLKKQESPCNLCKLVKAMPKKQIQVHHCMSVQLELGDSVLKLHWQACCKNVIH